jgi:hypothetical protein
MSRVVGKYVGEAATALLDIVIAHWFRVILNTSGGRVRGAHSNPGDANKGKTTV